MSYENLSQKHMNDLEQQTRQLLTTIKRAKIDHPHLVDNLNQLAQELEQVRHARFDSANTEYHTT